MSPQLDPSGAPVSAGAVTVGAPGYSGSIEEISGGVRRRRGAVSSISLPDDVAQVLGDSAVDQSSVVVAIDRAPSTQVRGRRGPVASTRLSIEVAPPPPQHGQVVLTADASGVVRWRLAVPAKRGATSTRRGPSRRRYEIDLPVGESPSGKRLGGTALGKLLVKVVSFPLVEKGIGRVADHFVGKWEVKRRPYRLRWFLPEDYQQPAGKEVTMDQLRGMNGKRALLMVHGTFSQSHSGMGRFLPSTMQELANAYEGRMLAFDHFTISHTPHENVEQFMARLPDDIDIDFDVVCHSRGGLVSRVLAEDAKALGGRSVRVRKLVFVATPNSGTALADGKHLNDFVDRYTNVLTLFPAPGVVDIIETVFMVVKQMAVGAFGGLDGINCMAPRGKFLKKINTGPKGASQYYAFAANYEPERKLGAQVKDFLADKIFGEGNDLIVPTEGVFAQNGSGSFPISDAMVFSPSSHVQHSSYFTSPQFDRKLREWLAEA